MIPNAAACLFFVLVLAKLLVIGVIGFASPWLFVQDALVSLVFAVIEVAWRGRRWIWIPYGLAVAWIAINVPVALVLRSWLTWPMLRSASGPLADSIRYYLTPANLVPLALVVAVGVALPLMVRRRRVVAGIITIVVALSIGGATTKAKPTGGFERNALTTLVAGNRDRELFRNNSRSLFSRESAVAGLVGTPADLSHLRGSARGMNVVVVILESTAAQYLGLYGAAEDPMPNLTKLAANAVVFDAAYAVYPESVKGLYATLCGRSPRRGAPLEDSLREDSLREGSLNAACSPLPKELRAAGYRTGLFHAGRFGYLGMDALVAQSGFDIAEDAGAIGGVVRSSFGVDEASTVERTLKWINAPDDPRPFCAMYMPAAGHHPYASAIQGPFTGQTEFDRYRNALHETDLAIGQLLAGVHNPTVIDPILLIVIADHGEAFGQHDGNVGHTLAIWEENVRVPMMMSILGVTKGQHRVASPASVLDIAPTILDLVGVSAPHEPEAGSLLTSKARMAPFFADYSREVMGLRDGCWKLQYDRDDERTQLFNVCEDPGETLDIAARFESVHDELVKRVEQFFAVRVRPRRVAAREATSVTIHSWRLSIQRLLAGSVPWLRPAGACTCWCSTARARAVRHTPVQTGTSRIAPVRLLIRTTSWRISPIL